MSLYPLTDTGYLLLMASPTLIGLLVIVWMKWGDKQATQSKKS